MRENMNSSENQSPIKEPFNSRKLSASYYMGGSQISKNASSE